MNNMQKTKPGYKQTAVGVIPEEWGVATIKEIFNVNPGGDINKQDVSPIKTSEFKVPVYANAKTNRGLYGYTRIARKKSGCITISGRGELGLANARYEDFYPIVRLLVLTPIGKIDIKYYEEVFNSMTFFVESTGVPQLTAPQVNKYKVPVPDHLEQRAIADILSTWDEAIQLTQQLITKLKARNKGLAQQLLTGNIRLKGFSEEWGVKKVTEVFEFLSTNSLSRSELTLQIRGNCIYNIHYGDIHTTYKEPILNFDKSVNIPVIAPDARMSNNISFLQDGDLIMTDVSEDYTGIGTAIELANIGAKKAVAGLHTFALRDKKGEVGAGYRVYLFRHPHVNKEIKIASTGSKVYGISKRNLAQINIIIPPLSEQRAIVNILSQAEAELRTTEEKLHTLKLQKKGLMQKLLTGEVRVKSSNETYYSKKKSSVS